MRWPKIFRRSLGVFRRRLIAGVLGWHVTSRRCGRGIVFAAHRESVFIELFKSYAYDLDAYWENALFCSLPKTREAALARMTALAHALEKGLSHPRRKEIFGVQHVKDILVLLNPLLAARTCPVDPRIHWTVATLREWLEHHEQNPTACPDVIQSCHESLERAADLASIEATKNCTREQIQTAAKGDFSALLHSRHSIRDFIRQPVDLSLIEQATAFASRSPSACNRQSVRVICLSKGDEMQAALALQNGNRGFSESIDKLLIVTFDTRRYLEHHERHLGYVDAGIFIMSLVHSLHFLGLGTCCLNWAVEAHTDRELHRVLKLPPYLTVACFVAVGHLPENFKVAASHRMPVSSFLEVRTGRNGSQVKDF